MADESVETDEPPPIVVCDHGSVERRLGWAGSEEISACLPAGLAAESFWHAAFDSLEADPAEHALLLTEPPGTTPEERDTTARLLCGPRFGVRALCTVAAPLLPLYHYSMDTGLVLDLGESAATLFPVYDGHGLVDGAVVLAHLGASALGARCGDDRSQWLEALFQPCAPLAADAEALPSLSEAVLRVIRLCDSTVQAALLSSIIVVGGVSLLAGLPERLQHDLVQQLAGPPPRAPERRRPLRGATANANAGPSAGAPLASGRHCMEPKVLARGDRRFACFFGGCTLGSLSDCTSLFVRAAERRARGDQPALLSCGAMASYSLTEAAEVVAVAEQQRQRQQQTDRDAARRTLLLAHNEALAFWTRMAPEKSPQEAARMRQLQTRVVLPLYEATVVRHLLGSHTADGRAPPFPWPMVSVANRQRWPPPPVPASAARQTHSGTARPCRPSAGEGECEALRASADAAETARLAALAHLALNDYVHEGGHDGVHEDVSDCVHEGAGRTEAHEKGSRDGADGVGSRSNTGGLGSLPRVEDGDGAAGDSLGAGMAAARSALLVRVRMQMMARWAADATGAPPSPPLLTIGIGAGVLTLHPAIARRKLLNATGGWRARTAARGLATRRAARALEAFSRRHVRRAMTSWSLVWGRDVLHIHEARHCGLLSLKRLGWQRWVGAFDSRRSLDWSAVMVTLSHGWRRWQRWRFRCVALTRLQTKTRRLFAGWRVLSAVRAAAVHRERTRLIRAVARAKAVSRAWRAWRTMRAAYAARELARTAHAHKSELSRGWRGWRGAVAGLVRNPKLLQATRRFERARRRLQMAGALGAWNAARDLVRTELVFVRTKADAMGCIARLSSYWQVWRTRAARWAAVQATARAEEERRRALPPSHAVNRVVRALAPSPIAPEPASDPTLARRLLRQSRERWRQQGLMLHQMCSALEEQDRVLETAEWLLAAQFAGAVEGVAPHSPQALLGEIDSHFARLECAGGGWNTRPDAPAGRAPGAAHAPPGLVATGNAAGARGGTRRGCGCSTTVGY